MEMFRDEKFTLKANGSEEKVYWKVMVIVAAVVFYKKLTIKSGTWVVQFWPQGAGIWTNQSPKVQMLGVGLWKLLINQPITDSFLHDMILMASVWNGASMG